jgi:hypothetical protein
MEVVPSPRGLYSLIGYAQIIKQEKNTIYKHVLVIGTRFRVCTCLNRKTERAQTISNVVDSPIGGRLDSVGLCKNGELNEVHVNNNSAPETWLELAMNP